MPHIPGPLLPQTPLPTGQAGLTGPHRICCRLSPPAGQAPPRGPSGERSPPAPTELPRGKGKRLVPGKRDSQKGRLFLTAPCSLHKPRPSRLELSGAGRHGPSSNQPGLLAFQIGRAHV